MKIKKKVLIPIAAVLAVAIAGGSAIAVNSSKPVIQMVDTTKIETGDLINSVSVTGMVQSEDSVGVYTTLNYPIQLVNVEVGDTVSEGDVLCQLDTADLASNLAQTQASVWKQQSMANHNLALAEKDLSNFQVDKEGDYNTNLLSADSDVKNAEYAVATAEANVRDLQHKVSDARKHLRDLRDDKKQVQDDESYDEAITQAKQAIVSAEIGLEEAQIGKEKAEQALEAAKKGQKATKKHTQDTEVDKNDAIAGAKISANYSDQYILIEKMKKDLNDATVKAPVSGTVTAVMAKEGAAGAGLLFVIEATSQLKVVTKIKEYDIVGVTEGMPVTIKSDGTGDEEYEGEVSLISPTSLKDASGKSVDTNNPEFTTEIKVTSSSRLRIGMNARLSIITEKKSNVISIPFESVVTKDDGEQIVYIAEAQEDGTLVAKAVPVTLGMETDFAVEISSSDLKDGDEVITTPDGLTDGMQVTRLDQAAIDQAIMA